MPPQFLPCLSRPREHLAAAGRVYPGAWSQADALRAAYHARETVNFTDPADLPAVVRPVRHD